MKSIQQHITERLQLNKDRVQQYKYFPETWEELKNIIKQRIKKEGTKCNLNNIDVSKITDMSKLFYASKFNGDISKWDVSKVKDMYAMFYFSEFNGDISKWNVSNVKNMKYMFFYSPFNQDISKWDVSNVENIQGIFKGSPLNGKEKEWWERTK